VKQGSKPVCLLICRQISLEPEILEGDILHPDRIQYGKGKISLAELEGQMVRRSDGGIKGVVYDGQVLHTAI
jgi:hypothetical protein